MDDIAPRRQGSLFPNVDLGADANRGEGCASPIGRRRTGHGRTGRARQRPNTLALFAELRGILEHQLGGTVRGLRNLETSVGAQANNLADISEVLEGLLRRVTAIERAVDIVERPQTPQVSRRRPLQ